jgi:hypothetical protein
VQIELKIPPQKTDDKKLAEMISFFTGKEANINTAKGAGVVVTLPSQG